MRQFVLELGVLVLGVLVVDGLVAQVPAPSPPLGLAHVSELVAPEELDELAVLESLDPVDFLFDPPE